MFSNFELISFIISIIPLPVIAYSAYRVLNIRRALAVRLYRNQALGVFLVAIAYFGYILTFNLYNSLGFTSLAYTTAEVLFSFGFSPLLTFYWIDYSIRTARRSDPLLREVLHWKQLRIAFWVWVGAAFSLLVGVMIIAPSSGAPALPLFISILSPIFLAAICGLVFLPRAARMAGDKRFGKHLLWFGLFIFFILAPLVSIFFIGGWPSLFTFAISQTIGGFCLYRSIRWLVPLNRLPSPVSEEAGA